MARIKKMYLRIRNVAFERLNSSGQEIGIIASPHGKQRRCVPPEILLELGIEGHVARIVEEEVELDLVRVRTRKVEIVESRSIRRHQRGVPHALHILIECRLRRECAAQRISYLLLWAFSNPRGVNSILCSALLR